MWQLFFCIPLRLTYPEDLANTRLWPVHENPLQGTHYALHEGRVVFTTSNLFAN